MTHRTETEETISVDIDAELLQRLDTWRKRQNVVPSQTATIEAAIQNFLDQFEAKLKREYPE